MTYARDANEIAAAEERRTRTQGAVQGAAYPPVVRGTLSIWGRLVDMSNGVAPYQSDHVTLDLTKPGLVIAYDENGDAEIFVPTPGWYMNFVPDREGE